MPPDETCIGILAKAVVNLEAYQFPVFFHSDDVFYRVLQKLAPYSSFWYKFLFGNLWLFRPLLTRYMMKNNGMAAKLRTTTAVTIFHSGIKSNVLPRNASAIVNFRVHPRQTIGEVVKHALKAVNDERVSVKISNATFFNIGPSPLSPFGTGVEGVDIIESSAKQIFPDGIIVPGRLRALGGFI